MKKTKRNKILLGTSLGLVLISGLTIGFSSWIIGINQPTFNVEGIGVTIDAVSEETSIVNIVPTKVDKKINIADTITDDTEDGISIEDAEADLEVQLDTFEVIYSRYSTFNSLTFTASLSDGALPKGTVSEGDPLGRRKDQYNYLDLELGKVTINSEDILDDYFTLDETVTGYKIWTLNNNHESYKSLDFVWGNFFVASGDNTTNQSPAAFYQGVIDDKGTTKEKLQVMNQARTDLEAMVEAFTGKTINITVTLSVIPNAVE